jgi:hypothetical protein
MFQRASAAILAALVMTSATAAQAQAPAASAPATTAPFSIKTPIETLAADPGAKAVLTRDLPDLFSHPMYESFKAMSLEDLAPYSNGAITPEVLTKVNADLAQVTPAPVPAKGC